MLPQDDPVTSLVIKFLEANPILYALLTDGAYTKSNICASLSITTSDFSKYIKKESSAAATFQQLRFIAQNMPQPMTHGNVLFDSFFRGFSPKTEYIEHFLREDNRVDQRLSLFCCQANSPIIAYINHASKFWSKITDNFDATTLRTVLSSLALETKITSFKDSIQEFIKLPDCIHKLTNDQRFALNSQFSIAFLTGVTLFPAAGTSSPHLRGQLSSQIRRQNTGFLMSDVSRPTFAAPTTDLTSALYQFFSEKNHLYKDIPIGVLNIQNDLNQYLHELSKVTIKSNIVDSKFPTFHSIGAVDLSGVTDKTQTQQRSPGCVTIAQREVRHVTVDGTDVVQTLYVNKLLPLEIALPLLFPFLFPYGKLPLIPGRTIRQKAQVLLQCDVRLRSGRLGCQLVLYLFDQITKLEISYSREHMHQFLNMPSGTNRQLPQVVSCSDPSFNEYWRRRQTEALAMVNHFGPPDLMLTLTFGNKWKTCESFLNSAESQLTGLERSSIDMRFFPIDSMKIWNEKIKQISSRNWKDFGQAMGLGEVTHFIHRLEFQARGAPHCHVLLWLKDPLSLSEVDALNRANAPPRECPILRDIVKANMIHTCYLARCKKGNPNQPCKYGFPHAPCESTHYDDSRIVYARTPENRSMVEYSPLLLLFWKAHSHLNIIKTQEQPVPHNDCHIYVLKYNMKPEPTFNTRLQNDNDVQLQIKSRFISSEEAAARILGITFCEKDTGVDYIATNRPSKRKATFIHGEQTQLDPIAIWMNRPDDLEGVGILNFYSNYSVNQVTIDDTTTVVTAFEDIVRLSGTLADTTYDDNLFINQNFVQGYIYKDQNHVDFPQLIVKIRTKPIIITLQKMFLNTDPEDFYYQQLLISGCWRSEKELSASQETYVKSAEFHGIIEEEVDSIIQTRSFLLYILRSSRYSQVDFVNTIIALHQQRPEFDLVAFKNEICNHSNFSTVSKDQLSTAVTKALTEEHLNDVISEFNQQMLNQAPLKEFIHNSPLTILEEDDFILNQISLNKEQIDCFCQIKTAINANNGNNSRFFIMGQAGTGKSFLIQTIAFLCRSVGAKYVLAASTGIAAKLINGSTLHSLFSIFEKDGEVKSGVSVNTARGFALSQIDVLVIDEVTMLTGTVLDSVSNKMIHLKSQVMANERVVSSIPFGGITVVILGDLAQISAVTNSANDMEEAAKQFQSTQLFKSFKTLELTRIMRQKPNEIEFIAVLSAIKSRFTDSSPLPSEIQDYLRSVFHPIHQPEQFDQVDQFVEQDSKDGMVIFYTNSEAEKYNRVILQIRKLPPLFLESIVFANPNSSFMTNRTNISMNQQRVLFQRRLATPHEVNQFILQSKVSKNKSIVPLKLEIAIAARVMLLKNINVEKQLVNGTRGTLTDFRRDGTEITTLFVKFDDQKTEEKPIPIVRILVHRFPLANGIELDFYQFPIKLCWAVTAHKSQGQTLKKVAISIYSPAFAHGAFYVALSRVKKLSDIMLFGCEQYPENGIDFHTNIFIQLAEHDIRNEIQNDPSYE